MCQCKYLGLKLNGPIVVSSTPLSESIDNIRHMEDAGASAVVLTSLFEEQLALESRTLDEDLSRGTDSFAESLGYLPDLDDYRMTHEIYLEHIRRAGSGCHPDYRESQWRNHRRVGAFRQGVGAGRRTMPSNSTPMLWQPIAARLRTIWKRNCLIWSRASARRLRFRYR